MGQLYKITFAVEAARLSTMLELLTEAAKRGGVSTSFVIELQAEAVAAAPKAAPKQIERAAEPGRRGTKGLKFPKRHRGPPYAHEVVIAYLQKHGPAVKGEIIGALQGEGFKASSINTAMDRVRKLATLRNKDRKWWIEDEGASHGQ